jgi:hypothetical protein
MGLNLGKMLFPKDNPWDRRRKLDKLAFIIVGSFLLIAVIVGLLFLISADHHILPGSNPRSVYRTF